MLNDYRFFLKRELGDRQARNPGYSLRAFARDLQMSPSHLCEVFSGRQRISGRTAKDISAALKLPSEVKNLFCALVDKEDERRPAVRARAEKRLAKLARDEAYFQLHDDEIRLIADWRHLALFQYLDLPAAKAKTKGSVKAMAKAFSMKAAEVTEACERLERLGLIKKQASGYVKVKSYLGVSSPTPLTAIKTLNYQLIDKARAAIDGQELGERRFNALILNIPKARLPDLHKRIAEFCREFNAEVDALPGEADEVYCLTTQFFRLTEGKS